MKTHRQAGIALLVVMMLGAIIIPFAAEFAYQISIESITASNVTDQLALDNALESQCQIVLARLSYDGTGNQTDSYDDSWNDEELRSRTDEDSGVNLSTVIFDEQGKFNLHMLAEASPERKAIWKERLAELIKRFRADTKFDAGARADEIAEEISRWVNGQTSRGTIPKPNTQDDRTMLVLEELKFVSDVFERERLLEDIREGEDVAPGLHRYITVYGTGKVNLNTADKVVLQAFFKNDPDIADRIIERRQGTAEEDEDTSFDESEESGGGNPFTDANQIMEVEGVTQPLLLANKVIPAEDFDVRSNFFGIRIAAQKEQSRREELFVVQRVPGNDPNGEIEGFRHLLCQERTDPLEELPEDE
ncbi:MAG: type II secretion system protein GspK [Planctomycetota bacterium]|nr:type II secretion system protein GspK [Planctomycetota bacterium]